MPKGLRLSECKTIYFCHSVGKDEQGKTIYSPIKSCKAEVRQFSGVLTFNAYGTDFNYNTVLYVSNSGEAKFINEFSKVWVSAKPFSNTDKANMFVTCVSQSKDGLVAIYCNTSVMNSETIWYLNGDNVLSIDVELSEDFLTARVGENVYFPIDKNSVVWYIEPEDKYSTDGLISLESISFGDGFKQYKFKAV